MPTCSFISLSLVSGSFSFFFFNDTATTEIYTLPLHDALPISVVVDDVLKYPRYIEAVKNARSELAVPLISQDRSEEHTSELQSPDHLVCRLLLEKKKIATDVHRDVPQARIRILPPASESAHTA